MKKLHVWILAGLIGFAFSMGDVPAQSNQVIKETVNGLFWWGGNEARADAKDLDAAKVRVGSRMVPGQHGGGGAYSFDGLTTTDMSTNGIMGSRRVEVAGIGGAFNGKSGELGVWVWNGRDINNIEDSDQPKAIEIRGNRGDGQGEVEFKMPVKFSAGVVGLGGVGGRVTRFYTDGGRYIINWQDDTGKPTGIIYDTHGTMNEVKWTAVGRIPIEYF